MNDPVILFRDALQGTFGPLDWLPIPDGQIHRFHVPGDKAGTHNGWYVLHLDGIVSGAFGSWKAGGSHTWSSRKPTDPMEAELGKLRSKTGVLQAKATVDGKVVAEAELMFALADE